ncbi:MAG: hypothetical protein N2560_08840 [Ignavibacteria bacterium]|nr:hypothetical protein [Ignavibacteria bacterium]
MLFGVLVPTPRRLFVASQYKLLLPPIVLLAVPNATCPDDNVPLKRVAQLKLPLPSVVSTCPFEP